MTDILSLGMRIFLNIILYHENYKPVLKSEISISQSWFADRLLFGVDKLIHGYKGIYIYIILYNIYNVTVLGEKGPIELKIEKCLLNSNPMQCKGTKQV